MKQASMHAHERQTPSPGILRRIQRYRREPLSWWQLSQRIENFEHKRYRKRQDYLHEAAELRERLLLSGFDPEIQARLGGRLNEALDAHERRRNNRF